MLTDTVCRRGGWRVENYMQFPVSLTVFMHQKNLKVRNPDKLSPDSLYPEHILLWDSLKDTHPQETEVLPRAAWERPHHVTLSPKADTSECHQEMPLMTMTGCAALGRFNLSGFLVQNHSSEGLRQSSSYGHFTFKIQNFHIAQLLKLTLLKRICRHKRVINLKISYVPKF